MRRAAGTGKIPGAIVPVGRRADARHADAAAGRRQGARRGHPCLHDRARHGSRLAGFNGFRFWLWGRWRLRRRRERRSAAPLPVRPDPVTLAAIAARPTARPTGGAVASKVQGIYKQLGASIAHRPSTERGFVVVHGAAALLLLLSLGARASRRALP